MLFENYTISKCLTYTIIKCISCLWEILAGILVFLESNSFLLAKCIIIVFQGFMIYKLQDPLAPQKT